MVVIIPARLASIRLPDKPLLDIGGAPMVVRTAQQAARSGASMVAVATDDPRIEQAVQAHGFQAILTDRHHPTGTDRLAEAARLLDLSPDTIVVNVQGDEPLVPPAIIDTVAQTLHQFPQADIATCACPIASASQLFDANVVKVVCRQGDVALYFSRAPIPWARDALADGRQTLAPDLPALRHIGLYAYRNRFLQAFPSLPVGPLEKFESLEQLRALENGYTIAVARIDRPPAPGVDTLADLEKVRTIWARKPMRTR